MRALEIGVVLGSWRSTTDGETVRWAEIRDLAVRAEVLDAMAPVLERLDGD